MSKILIFRTLAFVIPATAGIYFSIWESCSVWGIVGAVFDKRMNGLPLWRQ